MKSKKNISTYIRAFCNYIINFSFFIIFILIGLCIYKCIYFGLQYIPNINSIYGNLISAFVTILLAFISYVAKIKQNVPSLLRKIKQRIYQFLSLKYNPLSAFTITNFNVNNFSETKEQGALVNSAIQILKNNLQNTILISGYAGKGKTTSIMLLLSAIANDKELYQVFSELQNRIVYFDSINDKSELLKYLQYSKKHIYKLIIIDNIQKYTISSINEIMDKIENLINYNRNIERNILVLFLYQETTKNDALYKYIKNNYFKDNSNVFELKKYVNIDINKHQKYCSLEDIKMQTNIDKIEDVFFKQHIKYVFYNRRNISIISFLNNIIFTQPINIPNNTKKRLFLMMAFIMMGNYNGYVTKKELHFFWIKNYTFLSIPQADFLIRYYVHNHILTPFPFLKSAYIFNEQIAKEYRKRLIGNLYYQQKSNIMAESIFLSCKESLPQKWIFFLFCSPDYCRTFSEKKRIKYFENALSSYHLQYILDLIEAEISVLPDKKEIFQPELGIIYIYNGEWEKARQILEPYLRSYDKNKDIWYLQLKIIETQHESYDKTYLSILTYMEINCSDPIILFQVKYWREHISMEQGIFNLNNWNQMVCKMMSSSELKRLLEDEHFSTRIVSDYERSYFLKGNIDYSQYSAIISNYVEINKKNNKDEEPLEYILSHAYYIQYDVLYQLGIWGYIKYGEIDPNIIPNPEFTDNNTTMNALLYAAIEKYDFCIRKYQSEGKKKYHTLKVRKSELTLCIDTDNYIEILNQYECFKKYANTNGIKLFEGYCETQKGKAFGLYANYMLSKNDTNRFEEYLTKAEECLLQAQKVYKKWGNVYGVFRASLLLVLIHMIQDKDYTKPEHMNLYEYQKKYKNLLSKLNKTYNSNQQFVREYNIIEYIQQNISRMDITLKVLKFYPVILQ